MVLPTGPWRHQQSHWVQVGGDGVAREGLLTAKVWSLTHTWASLAVVSGLELFSSKVGKSPETLAKPFSFLTWRYVCTHLLFIRRSAKWVRFRSKSVRKKKRKKRKISPLKKQQPKIVSVSCLSPEKTCPCVVLCFRWGWITLFSFD